MSLNKTHKCQTCGYSYIGEYPTQAQIQKLVTIDPKFGVLAIQKCPNDTDKNNPHTFVIDTGNE